LFASSDMYLKVTAKTATAWGSGGPGTQI
jgi:hypothetical protein